jgi:hypothetical protein
MQGLFSGTMANFTGGLEGAPSNYYTVTINWGDGNSSPGTLTPLLSVGGVANGWQVSGTHQFNLSPLAFTWNGSVVIVDKGGQTLTLPVSFSYPL